MSWTGVARAAVSGITGLFPALLKPLNGEKLNQSNFGALDAWATNVESLRAASWYSDELTIAGGAPVLTGTNWTAQDQSILVDEMTLRIPYWEITGTASPNGVLLIDVPHPRLASCYLSGYTVISRANVAHSSIPPYPFRAALMQYRSDSTYFYRYDNAADTTTTMTYDAAQEYRITIASGGGLRPQLNQYRYALALRQESGAGSQLGRQVRGVLFHFSKTA